MQFCSIGGRKGGVYYQDGNTFLRELSENNCVANLVTFQPNSVAVSADFSGDHY